MLDSRAHLSYQHVMAAHRRTLEGASRPTSPRELQAIVQAEREGTAFFVYRDAAGEQWIVHLKGDRIALTVGRSAAADLSISWDTEVSSAHAEVRRLADELILVDDGLSRNGSYVNGERVSGRRRLRDGDLLRFGRTLVLLRNPSDPLRATTSAAAERTLPPELSEQQRKVLTALCRPIQERQEFAAPATNQQIADELHLTVGAVKLHLRALFVKFQIADLPQNAKRQALVATALRSGIVVARDSAR